MQSEGLSILPDVKALARRDGIRNRQEPFGLSLLLCLVRLVPALDPADAVAFHLTSLLFDA